MHVILLVGIVAPPTALNSYLLDAYRGMSNEILSAGIIFKNFVFHGLSYFLQTTGLRSLSPNRPIFSASASATKALG